MQQNITKRCNFVGYKSVSILFIALEKRRLRQTIDQTTHLNEH